MRAFHGTPWGCEYRTRSRPTRAPGYEVHLGVGRAFVRGTPNGLHRSLYRQIDPNTHRGLPPTRTIAVAYNANWGARFFAIPSKLPSIETGSVDSPTHTHGSSPSSILLD
jgi:hypothetical protein